LQNAALGALAPVVADERCYRKVLPAIGEMLRTCQLYNANSPVRWGTLPENPRAAGPEVQKLAVETLRGSCAGFTGVRKAPGGQNVMGPYDSQLEVLATSLANRRTSTVGHRPGHHRRQANRDLTTAASIPSAHAESATAVLGREVRIGKHGHARGRRR